MQPGVFYFFLLFAIPFIGVVIATPLISKFALSRNIVDRPGLHKTHLKAQPLLGGVAIFIGFAATLLIFLPVDEKLLSLVLATLVLVATGLFDDIYDLRPWVKLSGQTAAAAIVVLANAHLYSFMIDYFARFYIPGFGVLMLIIGWIVLMINAFNLIDGLDGLAAGTAAIIFLAMATLSIFEGGRPSILGVQLIGAGACFGFLIYNFYPARIFMGDTGSMLLGFILATTHLFTIKFPFSSQLVLGSMFILAYPALDVGYAIYRRICNRSSIFRADKGHIHHVLLGLGFSVRKTVLLVYGANVFFAVMAVILLSLDIRPPVLLTIWIITIMGVLLSFYYLLTISKIKAEQINSS